MLSFDQGPMDNKLLQVIREYANGTLHRAQFSGAFADLYFHVRRSGDRASRSLCSAVVGPFAEFSRGDRAEESFREVLADLVRPFAAQVEEGNRKGQLTE